MVSATDRANLVGVLLAVCGALSIIAGAVTWAGPTGASMALVAIGTVVAAVGYILLWLGKRDA